MQERAMARAARTPPPRASPRRAPALPAPDAMDCSRRYGLTPRQHLLLLPDRGRAGRSHDRLGARERRARGSHRALSRSSCSARSRHGLVVARPVGQRRAASWILSLTSDGERKLEVRAPGARPRTGAVAPGLRRAAGRPRGRAPSSRASSRSSPSRVDAVGGRAGPAGDDLAQLGADVVERRRRRRPRSPPGSRRRRARGSAGGAAPRRRSAGRRCRRGSRASRHRPRAAGRTSRSRRPRTSRSSRRSRPQRTTPLSHASRSSASMPCTRQIASMFAVLPPLTQIASCERTSSRRSVGRPREEVFRCDSSPRPAKRS